jgi:hypothetical protein
LVLTGLPNIDTLTRVLPRATNSMKSSEVYQEVLLAEHTCCRYHPEKVLPRKYSFTFSFGKLDSRAAETEAFVMFGKSVSSCKHFTLGDILPKYS